MCVTWCTFDYWNLILAYMNYFPFGFFHLSYMKYFSLFPLTSSIFIFSYFICLTWRTSNSSYFILAYTKHLDFGQFGLFHMKYLTFGGFPFTLDEVFPYRAMSFVLHDVLPIRPFHFCLQEVFSFREISFVLHEVLPLRAISFYLTWRILISTHYIRLTSSISYYFNFVQFRFTLHEVVSYRAISFVWQEVLATWDISLYLTWSIFISNDFICLTQSTFH